MKKSKISLLLALAPHFLGVAQESLIPHSERDLGSTKSKYWMISAGIGSGKFRDFGTAPLFFSGMPKTFSLVRIVNKKSKEVETGGAYSFGNYSNTFNSHESVSATKIVDIYHSRLYLLNSESNKRWKLKVGGMAQNTANLRFNPSFLNAGTGIDVIPTIFGSIKFTRDISRYQALNKRFLFFKYTREPKSRTISARLNVGLLNGSFRNGFTYIGQEAVLNKNKILDGYQFSMTGQRYSTVLEYTIYRPNKNAIRWSYQWDAYKANGSFASLEMAQHSLKFAFLFNSNSK